LTLVWGATSRWNCPLTPKSVAAVCAVAILYALSDEWHQSFVPNRDASPVDLAADFLGSVTSVMIVYGLGQGRSRE
ncbi:MAG: VanZ family protein, partial [Acidobacteriota bacterium]